MSVKTNFAVKNIFSSGYSFKITQVVKLYSTPVKIRLCFPEREGMVCSEFRLARACRSLRVYLFVNRLTTALKIESMVVTGVGSTTLDKW